MNDSFAHTRDFTESTLQRKSGQYKESHRTVLRPEAYRVRMALANHLHKQLGVDKKSYYKVTVHVKITLYLFMEERTSCNELCYTMIHVLCMGYK
jgi:hypothetical protein